MEGSGNRKGLPTVPVDGLYLYHAEERLDQHYGYTKRYMMVVERAEVEGPEDLITSLICLAMSQADPKYFCVGPLGGKIQGFGRLEKLG